MSPTASDGFGSGNLIIRNELTLGAAAFGWNAAAATLGIGLLYLFGWFLSIFGIDLLFIEVPGNPTGITISIIISFVAALNLFIDFDIVERGSKRGHHQRWSGTARLPCYRRSCGCTSRCFD
jgi:uncharacterized YccA/Bax inhibitor family protein